MHSNFNDWFLEASITLRDDQLKNRWEGVEEISKKATKDDIINLVKIFYSMPVDKNYKDTFAETFIKIDAAFSRKNEIELAVLAGAVLAQIAIKYNLYSFCELLVRAAFFGNRRPAVSGIYQVIGQTQLDDMITIRESTNDEKNIQTSSMTLAKALETSGNAWTPDVANGFNGYAKTIDASIKELNDAVNKICKANKVYFEDSQLLWWLTAGWSKDLRCSYKLVNSLEACLIIGKEAAELVRIYPGPYSIEGVLYKVVEYCKKNTAKLDFSEVISQIDGEWKKRYNEKYDIPNMLELLPVTAALAYSENTESKNEWIHKYNHEACISVDEIKCAPFEYAVQMYFEVLAQKCYFDL
ncbi:GTPase-associated system all-helical protein GASH [uncultured Anaeromusa sp.]|uniref:GTPase-associated system all-helical protein GASH n=1 Tax=uncultured Anaeromusa sp. TaxID=673273 RepID=UPI0029C65978|nr:GTPase-associated system all-helical protein GASH [uncultured Anaeromusa sp.]